MDKTSDPKADLDMINELRVLLPEEGALFIRTADRIFHIFRKFCCLDLVDLPNDVPIDHTRRFIEACLNKWEEARKDK